MKTALRKLLIRLALLLAVVALVVTPMLAGLDDPLAALRLFLFGPLSTLRNAGSVVTAATPLLFTGLAVSLMFRAGMFNLGAEGAFFLGGVAATWVLLRVPLPEWALSGGAIVAGGLVGGLVCLLPSWMRARYGASELVTSLMLNYAALFFGLYLVNYWLRDPDAGAMLSYHLPPEGRLTRLLPGTRIHSGVLAGLVACALGAVYLFRTRWGYEARIVGSNPGFARHLGLPVAAIAIGVQALGGFIAAAGGAVEVQGMYTRFAWTDLPGQGWNGLVVAILAGNHPLLVVPAAVALAMLQVGGDLLARNFNVPLEMTGLIKALLIFLSTAAPQLPRARAWLRQGRRQAATLADQGADDAGQPVAAHA
ncbi:ABC transporter permease [Rugamonas sp.]|uniref:ABC transporter permease n=1 Tax=Rugamonas sp. TaxID=1926287 RepID=UPI00260024A5|nr:ABC transporter permease [Rugamonas sp.]